jgi:hypothetical protein
MSSSETATSLLSLLNTQTPKSTINLVEELRKSGGRLSVSDAFDILAHAETTGQVKRVRTDKYDERIPVSTISWILIDATQAHPKASITPPEQYIQEAMIVVSQPIFLSVQGIDLHSLGMPVLSVREAMEKVVLDAKSELRIACPYYDELFIDVLSNQAACIAKLRSIFVLSDNMDPILVKARALFQNAEIRTLYQKAPNSAGLKLQGIHAKIIIADRTEVLIGSFNFRFSHINYNIDLGLLAKGKIAEDYCKIYDSIWRFRP